MAAVVKAIRAAGCANCRLSLIRSFTSLSRPAICLQPRATSSYQPSSPSRAQLSSQIIQEPPRKLSQGDSLGSQLYQADEADRGASDDQKALNPEASVDREASSLPWYLQAKTSELTMKPLSERQRIPELPESSPPVLGPLLQQISVDLGLDDLSLLDLRKLDPPPALGANLLMIISTARSEKHLHVSADRLCRWLRSTYKLRPDADGLLGRNEMKLRLRRKSRRAKLMGNAIDENGDDGVRTGWVCVDVGVVEGSAGVKEAAAPTTFVGFGRRTDGVRVVVQMLTEEKREEIDLERLWSGILRRSLQTGTEQIDVEVLDSGVENAKPSESLSLPSH